MFLPINMESKRETNFVNLAAEAIESSLKKKMTILEILNYIKTLLSLRITRNEESDLCKDILAVLKGHKTMFQSETFGGCVWWKNINEINQATELIANELLQESTILAEKEEPKKLEPTKRKQVHNIRKQFSLEVLGNVPGGFLEEKRPNLSYKALTVMAIQESPNEMLTLAEICEFIKKYFPFYRKNQGQWGNAIRHNLSYHRMFEHIKKPHEPRGFWKILQHSNIRKQFTSPQWSEMEAYRSKIKEHDSDASYGSEKAKVFQRKQVSLTSSVGSGAILPKISLKDIDKPLKPTFDTIVPFVKESFDSNEPELDLRSKIENTVPISEEFEPVFSGGEVIYDMPFQGVIEEVVVESSETLAHLNENPPCN